MLFALVGVFFSRCKIYDESNKDSYVVNSTTNMSISNNTVSTHNNNGHNNIDGGKLKILVQKPCFKIIVGLLSIGGIIAYSVFANMCYYKLNCEEIHPYIVFIPVRYQLMKCHITPTNNKIILISNHFTNIILMISFIDNLIRSSEKRVRYSKIPSFLILFLVWSN